MDDKSSQKSIGCKNLEEEVVHLRDEIKKLEGQLAELGVYEETVEHSSQGYIKISPDGIIKHANTPAHKILGYDNKELIDASILNIYPIEYKDAMAAYLKTLVENKPQPKPYYGEFRKKDGSPIEVKVQWSYILSKYGDVIGLINIVEDLTEQKQREKLLYNSKSRLESLMEHAPIMVMEFDREYRHIFINDAVKAITGADPEFFIGKTMEEAGLPEFIAKPWMEKIKKVFESGEKIDDLTIAVNVYYSILTPVLDHTKRVKSVMVTTVDITNLEERVEELKKEANAPHI